MSGFPLTENEKLFILGNIKTKGICEIAKRLNRTEPCIRGFLKRKNINYKSVNEMNKVTYGDIALSPREFEVLGLVARGLSNVEICNAICVERPTLATHLHHIYSKLGLFDIEKSAMRVRATLLYLKNVKGLDLNE